MTAWVVQSGLVVPVPERFELPPLADLVPGAVQEVREAPVSFRQRYLDTTDLRLARWGAELRVRLDGPDVGWRLVLPSDGSQEAGDRPGARSADVAVRASDPGEDAEVAPPELLDLVRALVREAAVGQVAEVRTTRTTVRLLDDVGRELALVHDDQVEAEGRTDGTQRRRRLQVTASGPTPDAERALARLRDAIQAGVDAADEVRAENDGAPPDAERARTPPGGTQERRWWLGGVDPGPPDVVVPRPPQRSSTAGEVLTHALALHVRAFLLADVAVRRDRPDAVHRLRVAARTLRSALRTFTPLCDESWAQLLRDRLAVAADALGAVRDTEVLYARLEQHAQDLPAQERVRALPALDALLRPRLLDARAAALDELSSPRYLQLLVDLVEAVRHPRLSAAAGRPAAEVLPALVTDDWRRLVHAARGLHADRLDPRDRAWHRARILAKRARYGAEVTAPSLRRRARRWADALSTLTDVLGELHDGVVAAEVLADAAAGADGPAGFALGRLLALEERAVEAAASSFEERWPHVRRDLHRHPIG